MSPTQPETVICHYHVKPGCEAEFEGLLARHWPALKEAGLVTDQPSRHFRGRASGKPDGRHGAAGLYVEIFEWKDGQAAGIAHQTPEIMAIWEPMGTLCREMDFPHFDPFHPRATGA
jgi:hypothetical protein